VTPAGEDPEQAGTVTGPADRDQPAEPAEPAESLEPVESAESAQTGDSARTGESAQADEPAVPLPPPPPRPAPAPEEPVLPGQTSDDTDADWRDREDSPDDRYLCERPPHW